MGSRYLTSGWDGFRSWEIADINAKVKTRAVQIRALTTNWLLEEEIVDFNRNWSRVR